MGSPASCMELELYGADDKFYSKLDQEDALLGSYPVDDGCRIHVRTPYPGPAPHSFTNLFLQQILCFAQCDNQYRPYPRGSPSSAWSEAVDSDRQTRVV